MWNSPLELGLTRHALREHLAQRQAFLGSRNPGGGHLRRKRGGLQIGDGDLRQHDRKRDYFLVKDLSIELERYRVVIDLALTDDFF